MGEIAEMMINGTMCPCGEFIDDGADGPGFPQYCSPQCKIDYGGGEDVPVNKPKDPRTINCPEHPKCERRFRTRQAAAQHWRDKHG